MNESDDASVLSRLIKDLRPKLNQLESFSRTIPVDAASEFEAIAYLRSVLSPKSYVPPAGGWAATYRTIAYFVDLILSNQFEGDVLELGGGTSTIWAGLAARESGSHRITSVDHDLHYAKRTMAMVSKHQLDDWVKVLVAPLAPVTVAGEERMWYGLNDHEIDDGSLGCLFIDGPPGVSAPLSRFPAFPMLREKLNDGALVLLDDINRSDELYISELWLELKSEEGQLIQVEDVSRTRVMEYECNRGREKAKA